MSWFSQFFGLDSRPAPSPSYSGGTDYASILKKMRDDAAKAEAERAAAAKKAQDEADYRASVQNAQSAIASNAGVTQSQRASMDAQQKANDTSIASSQQYGVPGTGYNPEASKMSMYSSVGAAPSTAADTAKKIAPAAYTASEQQNKTGSQSNKFNLPNTQGLTFGGAY
jgi:hypothetical protein